jgi:membrane protein implicated in regulation of membrane protease activity
MEAEEEPRRMTSRRVRAFWTYLLLQVPDVLLAGLILLLLHRRSGLPSAWALGLFAVWVLKDLGMYFLLRDIFIPSRLGVESLVGARAVAREPLAPRGLVMLGGELWSAESRRSHEVIGPGSTVIVRASRGLTLLVEAEDPVGR